MIFIFDLPSLPPYLSDNDLTQLYRCLEDYAGKKVCIQVKKHYSSRSLEQNSWYWSGVLRTVADYTGHTANELHEYFKQKFLPKEHIQVGSDITEVPCSTTKLNTEEFGKYIESIRLFAEAELGVHVPPPLYVER